MGHSVFNKISGQQRFSVEIGELYDRVRLMDWLCFDWLLLIPTVSGVLFCCKSVHRVLKDNCHSTNCVLWNFHSVTGYIVICYSLTDKF